MTNLITTSATYKLVALVFLASLPAYGQGQATPSPNTNSEMAALQTKVKVLQLQKQIDALQAQKAALEKQQPKNTETLSTDRAMEATMDRIKVLAIEDQIDALEDQQRALLNPTPTLPPAPKAVVAPAAPGKPFSAEDAEIQRLEEERQRLLKQQEIERLRKQNEQLQNGAPPPAPAANPAVSNCTPQQGPKIAVKAPPKASSWACQHLGVCLDNSPIQVSGGNACPPNSSGNGQVAKQ
jgi:hypothetical protein